MDLEIYCRVFRVPDAIVEPDDDASFSSNMVSIRVIVTFMPYSDSETEEEEDDDEGETSERTFLVERQRFLLEETSRSTVRQIFLDMNVPPQEFWINYILCDVRHYERCNVGSEKVLHLEVEIEVPVQTHTSDGLGPVPATKSSIDALETVKVEGSVNQRCSICLEEILIGSEAICMPCSHLYHRSCICNWLERSRVCPMCRFEVV
ncbi:E3 ubiquitin-protein ligase Praja-1 [Manihot esculenta]|uniref:RING-type E3 ubiquitin transferase n=1 Tax=Manihot esculenta TaxID=3983 RepID=A0A2C9U7E6_MANES|nr:E3 ubiquitin-protein ligase Praja-1 [Manihot esculenta]OAY25758.1 hypothetical protein MANES_17G117600v8 [Manihot esculenta]